jgi:glycosyltransferase involved in cell wall biosynthesis
VARVLSLIASNQRRGAEVFAERLTTELQRCGHDVTLLAVEPAVGDRPLDVEIAGSTRWDVRGLLRVRAAARAHDVVIGHGSSALLTGALGTAGTDAAFIYRGIGDPAAWGNVRASQLRIGTPLRRANAVTALYPAARSELLRRYRLDPERVEIVPNGVPDAPFNAATDEQRHVARQRFGLGPSRRWVGCVGALSPEKNVAAAIRAIGRCPGTGLAIAGDGPLRPDLERLAAECAPGQVAFCGVTEDIDVLYHALDALLIPSHSEGIPAVAIEAAFCELPVVATAVGGMNSVVVSGRTGVLADVDDDAAMAAGIRTALEQREQFGQAGRSHCLARFSMTVVGTQWAELIERVLQAPR